MSEYPPGPTSLFYQNFVPKDPVENVRFRRKVLQAAHDSEEYRRELWMICARDVLFYINVFGTLLEPRDKPPWSPSRAFGEHKEIPFITRPYQDTTILQLQEWLGTRDVVIEKSREMGATWMFLYLADWEWRFKPQIHIGFISKDEKAVASDDDPDSLFGKLDFLDSHLPSFLRVNRSVMSSENVITNLDNGSTIVGHPATKGAMRGGRKKFVVQDEMHFFPPENDYQVHDSLQHATYCRIMVSTVNRERGMSGAFYDVCTNALSDVGRIVIDWKDDRDKAAGLYTAENGKLKVLDTGYKYPDKYRFILDGRNRSPYYDFECRRPLATDASIAAELDRNFGGAAAKFFDSEVITAMLKHVREPSFCAFFEREGDNWMPNVIPDDGGDCEFWMPLVDVNGQLRPPPEQRFSLGIDVSAGTAGNYSSYSAFVVIRRDDGEQVFQFRSNRLKPDLLARMAVAVGQFFNWAVIAPEVTGTVGQQFLDQFRLLRYRNPFLRPASTDSLSASPTLKIGIHNSDGGEKILAELQKASRMGIFVPRSKLLVTECDRYQRDQHGRLKHPLVGKGQQNAPERSHGDCAIAGGCAWWAQREAPVVQVQAEPEGPPPGSWLAGRRDWQSKNSKGRSYWSPLHESSVSEYPE